MSLEAWRLRSTGRLRPRALRSATHEYRDPNAQMVKCPNAAARTRDTSLPRGPQLTRSARCAGTRELKVGESYSAIRGRASIGGFSKPIQTLVSRTGLGLLAQVGLQT